MSRDRKGDVKPEKCDLWSYPQYYPVTFSGVSEMKEINFVSYNNNAGVGGGGILSPLSLNAETRSPPISLIKHQPYLEGFGESSILAGYSDGHQLEIVQEQQQQLHQSHSRLNEGRSSRGGFSSASPRSSGGESCSRESSGSSAGGGGEGTSRRHRQETDSQREERLRKNAERGKVRRLEESEDQRQRRLARNAERGKLRRMEESRDKREERLKKNADRQKARRNKESPEERQLRLWKNAERQRIRRNQVSTTSSPIKSEFTEWGVEMDASICYTEDEDRH